MDPKFAILAAVNYFLDGDLPSAAEHLSDYQAWRRKGGFEPSVDFDTEELERGGFYKRLTPDADNVAGWLFAKIRDACEDKGIDVVTFDAATLDRIDEAFGSTEE